MNQELIHEPNPNATAVADGSAGVTATFARRPWRLAALLLATAALTVGGVGQAQSSMDGGITVTGSGVAYGEPDEAVVTLGVNSTGENVRAALDAADAAMNAVRDALLALGIEQQDIRTIAFNVWRQQLTDRDGEPTGERYNVQHSYQISVRDEALVGDVLTAAVEAGANEVGGIAFTISDTAALEQQARAAAIDDARARAEQLAELAGVTLGAPTSIQETSYNAPRPAAAMMEYSRVAGSPVEGGQLAVNVTLSVTYAIEGAAQE